MAHHVYAGSNEIASKSSDGKSLLPPTDICWTPPKAPPTPMGVPVPYPNTCFGNKITNGTRTVFIKKKMVSMADTSYFSTSVGNEPATKVLDKGLISHAITGKCYFKKWVQNVKVEGKGVSRNTDPVSHNHSNPANALVVPFMSRAATKKACANETKAVEEKCTPTEKGSNSKRDQLAKEHYKYKRTEQNAWVDDHCGGLWIKPSGSGVNSKGKSTNLLWDQALPSIDAENAAGAGKTGAQEEWLANDMKQKAETPGCIKAKRCVLLTYKDSKNAADSAKSGKGCCPGQTGHHAIPGAMMKGHPCYKDEDAHDKAPIICLEGANNVHASHGAAHTALDRKVQKYKDTRNAIEANSGETIPYKQAKKMCLDAIQSAGARHCSRACLGAQLDENYKKCTKKGPLKAHSGKNTKRTLSNPIERKQDKF